MLRLLIMLAVLCSPFAAHADDYKSAFDRVMATNTLRCGYILYPPALTKDPNTGQLSGINFEIIEQIGRDLGLKVEWAEEVGSASWQEGLARGRYDILCVAFPMTTARARVALGSDPVYFVTYHAYVRSGDTRFDHNPQLANSPDVSVAVIDGSTAENAAQANFPLAKRVSLPDLTDYTHLLLSVQSGKADLTISDGAQIPDFEAKNPGVIRRVPADRPLLAVPGGFFFALNEMQLAATVNAALQNLQYSGFMDKLLDGYEKDTAVSFMRVALPYRQ